MADERIVIDVSQALGAIAQLKGGMADAQAQAAKSGKAVEQAFNVGVGQGMVDALNDIQREYNELQRSSQTLQRALKSATDPTLINNYVKSIGQLELGMKRLETAGKAAGVNLKEVSKNAGTGKQVFEGLFGAFTKVTLITAAIQAVAKFTTYAVGLSQQIRSATKSFEAFTGSAGEADKIVNSLIETGQKNFIPTDNILQAGKALLAFGENADQIPDVLTRIANISAATGKDFNELTTIYGKARAAGVLYAEDINQLVDAGIPIIQEFAKQMGVSNDQVKKLASEGKISFEELQLAMFNLTAEGGKFANQAQAQSDSIGGAWKKLVATVQPAIEGIGNVISDVVVAGLNAVNALADGIGNLFSGKQTIEVDYTGRDAYEKAKDDLFERERLEKEAEAARRERNKKAVADAANFEKLRQQAIINGMKDGVEKQIAQENFRYNQLLKELRKYHINTEQATEQHERNLQEIQLNEVDRQYALLQKSLELRKQIYEADTKNFEAAEKDKAAKAAKNISSLEALRDLKAQEIDIAEETGKGVIIALEKSGATEAQIKQAKLILDQEIQKARLENELAFQNAFLETIDAGNTAQLDSTLRQIDLIKAKIANIEKAGGGEVVKKKSLLERLGFAPDEIKALADATRKAIDLIQEVTAANVEAADNDLQIAQDKTDAARQALEDEIKRKEEGFANNVGLRERELEQAKADEEKALAQKKKAQRQQILLDSALQASSLVTSSTNIIKSLSPLGPIGLGIAFTAIASMFGAFIAAKSKALQATKLRHGGQGHVDGDGIILGPSHESGGVPIEAEGGEFFATDGRRFAVVNKKMTAKHFDLLAAVNRGDNSGMIAAVERITQHSINRGAVSAAIGAGAGSVVVMKQGDNETANEVRAWRKETRSKVTRTVEGNFVVEREGAYTRKTKIR